MLKIEALYKSYNQTTVIKNLNYEFSNTGIYRITGKNGVGKSTLLRIIGGAELADSGTVQVGKFCSLNDPLEFRRMVCWMPGEADVFPFMTASELLRFHKKLRPTISNSELKALIEGIGLDQFLNTRFDRLSTGNKKKTLVLMTLASQSHVLLFDEPTNGLDVHSQRFFLNSLDKSRFDKLIIVIDHFAAHEHYQGSECLRLEADLISEKDREL